MKWIAIIFIFSLAGCKQDKLCSVSVKISLINKSTDPCHLMMSNGVDSVVIDANSNSTVAKDLCFSESLKNDGSYKLQFSNSRKDISYDSYGYYSNGSPMEKEWQITWENDSLSLKSVLRDSNYR
ncbi:hypothetical protein WG906_06370 [Pedobacter sp. P351]|uniref:hypothetical protein n=1 Tax=Pedobacter superstes TaxID=3133441 RepID=UPI0030A3BAA5